MKKSNTELKAIFDKMVVGVRVDSEADRIDALIWAAQRIEEQARVIREASSKIADLELEVLALQQFVNDTPST